MTSASNNQVQGHSTGILWTAIAFGLATGLLEGLGLLIFHGYGWGNTRIPEGVSASIIWISAAVNLVLFAMLGTLASLAQRALPNVSLKRPVLFVFCFLAFVDLAGLSGRIGPIGAIVFAAGLTTLASRWFGKKDDALRT